MDDIYIRRVCDGDKEAFRYFVKEYKDMAFSIAMSVVKDEYLAEEIVQDAFIKAFNGLNAFHQKSKFSTWFYRIVINESFATLKKLKKEIVSYTPEYDIDIINENDMITLKENEQTYLINEALKQLSPNESLSLRLFYLEEESLKEIGEITGWTESNTKIILHRARKNMFSIVRQLIKLQI